jgi:DNA-binding transcriptional MerR regulator
MTVIKSRRKKTSAGTAEIVIPGKLYFRIGEVAELCKVPAYVLRFWESEFPQLSPNKSSTGQRLYRRKDVESAVRIRRLLYEEGYTIAGARQILKSEHKNGKTQSALPFTVSRTHTTELREIRQGLREIQGMLLAKR